MQHVHPREERRALSPGRQDSHKVYCDICFMDVQTGNEPPLTNIEKPLCWYLEHHLLRYAHVLKEGSLLGTHWSNRLHAEMLVATRPNVR